MMRSKAALAILLISTTTILTEAAKCPEDINIRCPQTEYGAYLKCLREHRVKRQSCVNVQTPPRITNDPCINSCTSLCYGLSCYDRCAASCQSPVQPVVSNCVPANCVQSACTAPNCLSQTGQQVTSCQSVCMNSCSGNACKDLCDKSCQTPATVSNEVTPTVQITTVPVETVPAVAIEDKGKVVYQPAANVRAPNVTTIIKLTNIVNNTNVINVPTTINNTNINNIDLRSNSSGATHGQEAERLENNACCQVVQPKVCDAILNKNNETVNRCIHRRHYTCGPQCRSRVVHAQVRQKCEGDQASCPAAISYVPQPQPRCIQQPIWPYVACGYRDNPSCEGCYDHYGYGFQEYHANNPDPPSCGGCYDDGYELGSLYRQGPFYRPGYYHTSPCYITGTCDVQQPLTETTDCGFGGCFGHELIDPVFGTQSFSPYASSMMMNSYPAFYPMAPMMPPMMPPMMSPMISPIMPSYIPYYNEPQIILSTGNDTLVDVTTNSTEDNSIVPQIHPYPYPYPYPFFTPYTVSPMIRSYTFPNLNETILIQETIQKKK